MLLRRNSVQGYQIVLCWAVSSDYFCLLRLRPALSGAAVRWPLF